MTSSAQITQIALQYAAGGFHVFPLAYGTKWPLKDSRGHLDATTDPDLIAELFAQRPKLNIGVSCRASGIVVIDVDVRNGGDETLARLEAEHGGLPDTPRVLSASGDGSTHYYLGAEEGVRYGTRLGPGVDLKWNGYAVLPPSLRRPDDLESLGRLPMPHEQRWRRYRWDAGAHINETPIALAPAWIAVGGVGDSSPGGHSSPLPEIVAAAPVTFLGVAFGAAGLLGSALREGKIAVRCPWSHEHSDGRGIGVDSSTVLLPATTDDLLGGFVCMHAHCAERDVVDVVAALPRRAIAKAAQRYPRAAGAVAWQRARARREGRR